MGGNSFGKIFKVTTFGESHGPAIGAVIDGCPAGLFIDEDFIRNEMNKRKPGQNELSSPRKEDDRVEIISGIYENKSLGTPIALIIKNENKESSDYDIYKGVYRPSHADYTYQQKYGIRDHRGGGRASARETAARVAAGAVAKLFLKEYDIEVKAFTWQIGSIALEGDYMKYDTLQSDLNFVRCPDQDVAERMSELIMKVKKEGDSIGGIVFCMIRNCPAGLGEPVFDKIEAELAKAMLGINASKGFEIGSGFGSALKKGTENMDDFLITEDGKLKTSTNHSGGVIGGISSGGDIYFKIAFKPAPSFSKPRKLLSQDGETTVIEDNSGRYDPCVVPRAVAVVEAMAALVIADQLLLQRCAKF